MKSLDKIFDNFFNNKDLADNRLANFASFVLNKLIVSNTNGEFTSLINSLQLVTDSFSNGLGSTDVATSLLKGATLTNNQVLKKFKATMSTEEPFIAQAIGGRHTAAYLVFYPHGIGEYSRASKTNAPILIQNIHKAATEQAAALGPTLTTLLQSFMDEWKTTRDNQEQQQAAVKTSRNNRNKARTALELVLLSTVYSIGAMFPGNVKKCKSFFNFSLLFAAPRHRHKLLTGTLATAAIAELLNRTLTNKTNIILRNKDHNAAFALWLAHTPGEAMPQTAIVLQPGHSKEIKPAELGNLQNTFLLIKNLSEVNEAAYEVEVIG